MRDKLPLALAVFTVAWIAFWMVAAVADHFTHFIGIF